MEAGAFTEENHALVQKIRDIFLSATKVGCTECRYCMPCPKNVNIPAIFRCYNLMYTENKASGRKEYYQTVALNGDPSFASQCIQCGKCEQHCPQHLPIREKLKEADKALRPFPVGLGLNIARRFMLKKK